MPLKTALVSAVCKEDYKRVNVKMESNLVQICMRKLSEKEAVKSETCDSHLLGL